MIEQLFYASGAIFFALSSFLMLKCYRRVQQLFSYYKMEPSITLPNTEEEEARACSEIDKYRQSLVQARVKTEDDLKKMSEDDIKKLYLKHEQAVIDKYSDHMTKLFAKGYTKAVSNVVPIENCDELESSLSNDFFIKAAVNEFVPWLYYRYGMYIAPVSILTNTATHVDYQQIRKFSPLKNGNTDRSEEEPAAEASLGDDNDNVNH